jgi:hypothetical protein
MRIFTGFVSLVFFVGQITALFRNQQWNLESRIALSIQWFFTIVSIILIVINLKKNNVNIDLTIMFVIMFKFYFTIMDLEQVRYT